MGTKYARTSESAALLGAIFYYDPASDRCAEVLRWIAQTVEGSWPYGGSDADAALADMRAALAETDPKELHREYNRLFIGPRALPAPPWGSVYTDPEGVIFGNLTLAVRQWMREHGVRMQLPDKEPEDHFGLMLLMLSWAAGRIDDAAIDALLEQHLLVWAPRFLELFIEGAGGGFYAAAGRLARATLADWRSRFCLTPPDIRLRR